jgi:glycosyltransferase involved in cell wall biosynthesis
MSNINKPLKILLCNEASFLSTGFAVYGKEFLNRLSNNNKFHVAELASYGFVNDPRDKDINWRYYANHIKTGDPRYTTYESKRENAFGLWRFEKTLLDFQPDVVIDIRDYWMNSYQAFSPLRKCFHWILMPTIDSAPQQEPWLDTFISADAIFTYSDWAKDVLLKQTNNKIKYINTTSPGINTSKYKILDQKLCRKFLGLNPDMFIIGSVMRNQKRKLIPDLIKSIRLLIDKTHKINPSLSNKIFLYLHTSYPDYMGWDIPSILKEYRMINRTLFTYHCKHCGFIFSNVFCGTITRCPSCNNNSCSLPSANKGISEENLIKIYNNMNFYVQYSICEGFGMPQVEAAACGVPVATVNYSAMEDIIKKINAYPIKVSSFFKELETQAVRAYPDNDNLVEIIYSFLNLPDPMKDKKKRETRTLCEKHYNWDIIYDKWEKYLLSLYDKKQNNNINTYEKIKKSNKKPILDIDLVSSRGSSNIQKLAYICETYLDGQLNIDRYPILEILNNLENGFISTETGTQPYSWNNALVFFNTIIQNHNSIVDFLQKEEILSEDFIQYAQLKDPKIHNE